MLGAVGSQSVDRQQKHGIIELSSGTDSCKPVASRRMSAKDSSGSEDDAAKAGAISRCFRLTGGPAWTRRPGRGRIADLPE